MNARATVLVVDDDEAIRETIAELLRDSRYDVLCAENGAQALALLESGARPGLVILDLMMPVMSGWELIERLRRHPDHELSQIPVVILSAVGLAGEHVMIHKPVEIDLLLGTVERYLA